ncbi:hypothetical protein ACN28E_33655 [Archangium lansingense]|uniref:hypothetical protein n=1 Tax=Archangium lansingense TaxID=2995310 RepID=UPI003B77FBA3
MDLEFACENLGAYHFPALKLRLGQSAELVLPKQWTSDDTTQLWVCLERVGTIKGIRVVRAGAFQGRRFVWWDRLWRVTLARVVADAAGRSMDAAREICRRCSVEPEQSFVTTPWTERKLVDFELATDSADLVVVDTAGLDPLGVRRFTEHIRKALGSHRFAVLALEYPPVSFDQHSPVSFHHEEWADVRFTISPR